MIRTRRTTIALLLPGFALLLFGLVIPTAAMLLAPPGVTTLDILERLLRMLADPYDLAIIARTVGFGVVVTAACLGLGFPIAYLLARTTSRWGGVLLAVAIFPLLLSNVIRTYGWLVVLGSNGLIGQLIVGLGLAAEAPQLLYTEVAVVLGLTQLFLPLAIVTMYSSVAQVDAGLDEAARGLGAGRIRTLYRIVIPLASPGIVLAATLVFAGAITAYTTPYLLGGSRQRVLSTQLYSYSAVTIDWSAASATALIMTLLVVLISSIAGLIGRRSGATR